MKTKILIAEDETPNFMVVRDALAKLENWTYLRASNSKEVLEVVQKEIPDLILMDWNMPPYETGVETLRKLKVQENTKNIPVIIISARLEVKDIMEAFEAGAEDYILKPIDKNVLLARVKAVIRTQKKLAETRALLQRLLPHYLIDDLLKNDFSPTETYSKASILSVEFAHFQHIIENQSTEKWVAELDMYIEKFDNLLRNRALEKMSAPQGTYRGVAGVPSHVQESSPVQAVLAALAIQHYLKKRQEDVVEAGNPFVWHTKITIGTGEVVAGVMGKDQQRFEVWGKAVSEIENLAKTVPLGKICLSESTFHAISDFFRTEEIQGENGKMYHLKGIKLELSENQEGNFPNDEFYELLKNKHFKQDGRKLNKPKILGFIEELRIAEAFEELNGVGVTGKELEYLRKEFIFGKFNHEYYERLAVFVKSL